jgi:phosphate-selective porin OprO/OprP
LLTDDTASYGHIEPRQPFNWSKRQWGAWEFAARYAQINLDPDSFTHNLADPTVSVLRAKSTTVGLNWYLNSNLRITGNFVHTDFTGATPAYRAANHEDGLMFRAQLTF